MELQLLGPGLLHRIISEPTVRPCQDVPRTKSKIATTAAILTLSWPRYVRASPIHRCKPLPSCALPDEATSALPNIFERKAGSLGIRSGHHVELAHGIVNQATTVMIRARAAITMIAHSVTQIANGTRFRCMFGQIKRGEVFCTTQKTSRAREPRMVLRRSSPTSQRSPERR